MGISLPLLRNCEGNTTRLICVKPCFDLLPDRENNLRFVGVPPVCVTAPLPQNLRMEADHWTKNLGKL